MTDIATAANTATANSQRNVAAPLISNRPRLRFIDGAPDGAAGTVTLDPGQQDPGQQDSQTPPDAKPGEEPKPSGGSDNPWDDPEKARKEIERLRRENGAERVNAKKEAADEASKQTLEAVAKALGLSKDEKPTVESLQKALQESQTDQEKALAEAKDNKRELAVYKAATAAGVDADRVLNLRSFHTALGEIDPSADNFEALVKSALDEEVRKDSSLRARGGSSRSGADTYGGSGGAGVLSQEDFDKMTVDKQTAYIQKNPTEAKRLLGA